MNLTPLKYLLFIENVTSVFRNYLCLKRRTRVIVVLWIVFESFNITASVAYNFTCDNEFQVKAQRIYYLTTNAFSIYIMAASLYYSKRFYSLLLNFDMFYNIFNDETYNKKMIKAQKTLTSRVLLFCGIKIISFAYVRVTNRTDIGGFVLTTLTQYIISISDFRYIFQYSIIHCILFVISEQLKAVSRSIDSELTAIRKNRVKVGQAENLPGEAVHHDKLDLWVKAYENIKDSANLCMSMFSDQLAFMLLIVITYYIILTYSVTIATVEGIKDWTSMIMNMYSIIVFFVALFLVSIGGQKVQNNYMELRQKLCQLGVYTSENEEYYKLTKDLLRCVRTRPVRVYICGNIDVNMSMLPSVVAFFTSYTVIALQFNNVL